jgi:hypothetical protein
VLCHNLCHNLDQDLDQDLIALVALADTIVSGSGKTPRFSWDQHGTIFLVCFVVSLDRFILRETDHRCRRKTWKALYYPWLNWSNS